MPPRNNAQNAGPKFDGTDLKVTVDLDHGRVDKVRPPCEAVAFISFIEAVRYLYCSWFKKKRKNQISWFTPQRVCSRS